MKKSERMPKADYFRMRYQNAIENGLDQKAEYYADRLQQMGEPIKVSGTFVKRYDFGNGLIVFGV